VQLCGTHNPAPLHTPLAQSLATPQGLPSVQPGQAPPPQSTRTSAPFCTPSPQAGGVQTCVSGEQSRGTAQSCAARQDRPSLQRPGQLPPQSTSDSSPSFSASAQLGSAVPVSLGQSAPEQRASRHRLGSSDVQLSGGVHAPTTQRSAGPHWSSASQQAAPLQSAGPVPVPAAGAPFSPSAPAAAVLAEYWTRSGSKPSWVIVQPQPSKARHDSSDDSNAGRLEGRLPTRAHARPARKGKHARPARKRNQHGVSRVAFTAVRDSCKGRWR